MIRMMILFGAIVLTSQAFSETFTLKSKALQGDKIAEDQVFNSFGCKGANISPDLEWSGAPKGTKAFAITMFDPDAPTGSGWWHWVVFNIPASAKGISLGGKDIPKGAVQSRTDFGKSGYGGPCPPPGKPHRYIFKVYALKALIPLKEDSPAAMVSFYAHQNTLAEASLEKSYGR